MKQRILIVDDERRTVDFLKLYLEKNGYQVLVAYDGERAVEMALQKRPDLILLDLMLPQVDGIEACRLIRARSKVPIIMLTARVEEADKLEGLEIGADDYVTKPFSMREVLARIRVVLRRVSDEQERHSPDVRFGDLVVDFNSHEVWKGGQPLHLTPKEFRLLETLVREPGQVFSRLDLVERVFGLDYEGVDRTVDVHLMNLRKKIEPDPTHPTYIQTVYGVGYRFAKDQLQ
jgi:DNA-binding response OmpR family regulator